MSFNRIFGPALDPSIRWYVVECKTCTISSEIRDFFSKEFIEVDFGRLFGKNALPAKAEWFGSSRKKDVVVVATAFGLLAQALRRKKLDSDDFVKSNSANNLIQQINTCDLIDAGINGGLAPMQFPVTPPQTPAGDSGTPPVAESTPKTSAAIPVDSHEATVPQQHQPSPGTSSKLSSLSDLNRKVTGPRNKVNQAAILSKPLMEKVKGRLTSKGVELGTLFGHGFLHAGEENKMFVQEMVAATVGVVAEKKGLRQALPSLLGGHHQAYIDSLRVPEWVQVFVKLATKMPDRAWQMVLNFLNVGRTGVRIVFLFSPFFCLHCDCRVVVKLQLRSSLRSTSS